MPTIMRCISTLFKEWVFWFNKSEDTISWTRFLPHESYRLTFPWIRWWCSLETSCISDLWRGRTCRCCQRRNTLSVGSSDNTLGYHCLSVSHHHHQQSHSLVVWWTVSHHLYKLYGIVCDMPLFRDNHKPSSHQSSPFVTSFHMDLQLYRDTCVAFVRLPLTVSSYYWGVALRLPPHTDWHWRCQEA